MNFKTLIENIKDGYFLQIGAYDGISNDEFGLSNKIFDESGHTAILVEPIPEYFDQLKKNYITAKNIDNSFDSGNLETTITAYLKEKKVYSKTEFVKKNKIKTHMSEGANFFCK